MMKRLIQSFYPCHGPDSERFNYGVKYEGDDPTNIFNVYQKDADGIFKTIQPMKLSLEMFQPG